MAILPFEYDVLAFRTILPLFVLIRVYPRVSAADFLCVPISRGMIKNRNSPATSCTHTAHMLRGLRNLVEIFSEVFQCASCADIHAHLKQSVAILNRFALNRHRELRLAAVLAEDECCDRIRTQRQRAYREYEPLGRRDFAVSACKRVFPTVGAIDPSKCPVWA